MNIIIETYRMTSITPAVICHRPWEMEKSCYYKEYEEKRVVGGWMRRPESLLLSDWHAWASVLPNSQEP